MILYLTNWNIDINAAIRRILSTCKHILAKISEMSSKKTLKYYIAQIIKDDVNTMLKEQRTMQKHENIYGQEGARKYGMKKRSVGGAGVSEFPRQCASCGKVITERYLLKALDLFWHEDCLKCGCCDCRLGEVGSTLYTKADLILCKRDYLRLFGVTGNCVACNKVIPAFEMVMKAKSFVYHLECFACQQCNHRFCVGDRFYLCDSKILCEYDYEERLVFASMAANPSGLAHIRKQVSGLQSPSEDHLSVAGAAPLKDGIELRGAAIADDGGSSGYGSPPDDNDVVCAQ